MSRNRVFQSLFACFLFFSSLHAAAPRKALSSAIEVGNLVKVQSLIESFEVGIDELSEDYDPKSPLIEAAIRAKIPIIKYLISKGACIEGASEKGYSPLVKFIEAGKMVSFQQLLETVRFFIDSGADVNGRGKDGYTPLMAACEHSRCVELVEMLLDMGAFIDSRAADENTAYLLSLRNNNVNAYRLLTARGANTRITWKGIGPLSVVAFEGNLVMAKILIEETGANVNAYDANGGTPLICAVIGKQPAMVDFLVERGANINLRTSSPINIAVPKRDLFDYFKKYVTFPKGSTALNFAKTFGDNAMTHLLIDLGGMIYTEVEYKEVPHLY